jgi:hypothetical protein
VIDLETVARIRHLHHAELWPVGTIAGELGLHHETVERALEETSPAQPAPRPSRFDPYVGFVREVLEKHPRLRATRIWQMLRERGCPLSPRQIRRLVARERPTRQEAFLRRRTFPAEEALCGLPHSRSYAAPGNMRRPPKAITLAAAIELTDAA